MRTHFDISLLMTSLLQDVKFATLALAVNFFRCFQIVFEAVFSDFTKSKVAIRDIVIVPGSCRARNKRTGKLSVLKNLR